MANTIFRSSDYQMRAFPVLGLLLCLTLLVQKISCTPNNFTIGGSKGWSVPDDPNAPDYNEWAEKNRFEIGDSIVFVYPAEKDSVLLVNQEDYNNCTTDHPLQKYHDGNTVYTFQESGPHYFISGNKDNCLKNEKVIVIVLAYRSNQTNSTSPTPSPSAEMPPSPAPAPVSEPPPAQRSNQTNSTSPTPSPSAEMPPSPAPAPVSEPPPAHRSNQTNSTSPTPSPSAKTPPSPAPAPLAGTVGINPTPAPVSEPPPAPSVATSVYMSFIGYIGALVAASSLLF